MGVRLFANANEFPKLNFEFGKLVLFGDNKMAVLQGMISVGIVDIDTTPASIPFYFTFDTTKTLAQIETFVQALVVALQPMLGADVVSTALAIDTGSVGSRGTVLEFAQAELTALQSWGITGVPNRTYGLDLAGVLPSLFNDGIIHIGVTAYDDWISFITAPTAGFILTDEVYQPLAGVLTLPAKTFRKKRKALAKKEHRGV